MELPDRSAPALNPERQIPSYDTCPASERPSASITRSSISTGRSKGSSSESTHRGSHELKPRLSKDQQEALERHYQSETKPSTQTKKEFSQLLGVSSEKINNWFQNRRAKTKSDFKKQREHNFSQLNEPSHTLDQHGHPLADDVYIDNAFYQIKPPVDDMNSSTYYPPSIHQAASNDDMRQRVEGYAYQTIPEEPGFGEDPAVLHYLGLPESNGYPQANDFEAISTMRKRFNEPIDHFDPAALFAQLQADHHSAANSPAVSQPGHESSFHHPSNARGEDQSFQTIPAPFSDGRRPSSSALATNTPANDSRNSSGSWPTAQTPFNNQSPDPRTIYQDAHQTQMNWNPDGPSYGFEHQNYNFEDFANLHHHSFVAPHPVLASQNFQGQSHPSMLQSQPPFFHDHQHSFSPEVAAEFLQPSISEPEMTESGQQEHLFGEPMDMMQAQQPSQDDNINSSVASHRPDRCDSAASMLAEPMEQEELPSAVTRNVMSKSAQGASSLAMRRQRRPVNLGIANSRSASYSNGLVTAGDASSKYINTPDPHLRRIKSSGVLNGRVQKSGTSSAQRSPYAGTFAEASAANHGPRHASNRSLSGIRSPAAHEVFKTPTTPSLPQVPTPHLHVHHPSNDSSRSHGTGRVSEANESVWSAMPDTAGTSNSSVYHSMPQTADTFRSFASPPGTPMDHARMAQLSIENGGQHFPNPYPPQSAPAWQQQFPPHHVQWTGTTRPSFQSQYKPPRYGSSFGPEGMNGFQPHQQLPHSSTMSMNPDSAPSPAYPQIHASSELPSGHSRHGFHGSQDLPPPHTQYPIPLPMQMAQQLQAQSSPHLHPPGFAFSMQQEPTSPNPEPGSPSTTDPGKQKQEIQFQQYEPREPADPASLPPKIRNTPPRGPYVFHNILPENFSSPKLAPSPLKIASPVGQLE